MSLCTLTNANITTQYKGQLVRMVGTTALLARSDSTDHTSKLVGVRLDDVPPGEPGLVVSYLPGVSVRMDEEPDVGELVYLSATNDGNATPDQPPLSIPLGLAYAKSFVGGVWYADVVPVIDTPSDGSTPLIAKGDLLSHDGSTLTRLPVTSVLGSNLYPDPTASSGVVWRNPELLNKEYHVGTYQPYQTIHAALTAIGTGNPATIYVHPGLYVSTTPYVLPPQVSVVALKNAVTLQNDVTDLFELGGSNAIRGCSITQSANTLAWAFRCLNNSFINIFECNMYGSAGRRGGYLLQDGATWINLSIYNSLIDSWGNNAIAITNTGGVRNTDCWVENLFLDQWHSENAGNACIWINNVRDIRFRNCQVRSSYGGWGVGGGANVYLFSCTSRVPAGTTQGNSVTTYAGATVTVANCDLPGTGAQGGTLTAYNSVI